MARSALWGFVIQGVVAATTGGAAAVVGDWRPVEVSTRELTCLHGAKPARIAIFACSPHCAVIPWQLDERDPNGDYVLDLGPGATADADRGAVDANDELVFMWSDAAPAGEHEAEASPSMPPGVSCRQEIVIEVGGSSRRVHAVAFAESAPRSPLRYVEYDAAGDVMRGRGIALTFAGPTPRGLELLTGTAAGVDLLDRLKIRAAARFFGIFPLSRNEDDILSVYEAWRVGPIRILRRERKWIRLAFGYRTPYLRTETAFYRDFVRLPVRFHLNFAPAQLFSRIEVRASLDFYNLRGWRFSAPGVLTEPISVGATPRAALAANQVAEPPPILALEGADATFALALHLGPTLQSLRRTVYYREEIRSDPPESMPGQMPGIGFLLTEWGQVEAGEHWFTAESFALPAGADPARFASEMFEDSKVQVGPPQ